MRMRWFLCRLAIVVFWMWFGCSTVRSDVKVSTLISDNMVLQRDCEVRVWGTADAGEQVTVEFGGQKVSATAGANGEWEVMLQAMPANENPQEMQIRGKNTIRLKNVLVGDVWLCSGQSNMWWPVKWSQNGGKEISQTCDPHIRLYRVWRRGTPVPLADPGGKWTTCMPEAVAEFSAAGYYFGKEIHKEVGVPLGLIESAYGATPIESWTSQDVLKSDPEFRPIFERWNKTVRDFGRLKAEYVRKFNEWRIAVAKAQGSKQPVPVKPKAPEPDPICSPWRPGGLYNAMVYPLVKYAIKGVIWYQGENNADRAYQYRKLFPLMIQNWRKSWRSPNLPFIFVQLANYMKQSQQPGASKWAELRDAQFKTLSVPRTGMVVAIDIGDANNIHPKDKYSVGRRLALAAEAMVYGKQVICSGPLYDSMTIEGDKVRIRFKYSQCGLAIRGQGPLKGFAIAGADRKFVWAQARIEGQTVVVWSPLVAKPAAVRYAWADNPVCNLYNTAGLPASPFRTDDWPGVTANSR